MEEKKKIEPHKSSIFDLDANYVAMAAYIGGIVISLASFYTACLAWLIPIAIYILEKKSSFVKDHAKQAFGLSLFSLILSFVLYIIGRAVFGNIYNLYNGASGLLFLLNLAVAIFIGFLSVVAIMRAYKYKKANIPFVNIIVKAISPILDKFAVKVTDMINKDDDVEIKEEPKVEDKEVKEEATPVQKN
jgi:uncharacterized membrane protein